MNKSIFLFLGISSLALSQETPYTERHGPSPTLSIEKEWASMTNPRHHDPKSFRYIVHALVDDISRLSQNIAANQSRAGTDNTIDLLSHPERISQKPFISTSLIDQDHSATFAASGFILDVPPTNIIETSPTDLASNMWRGHSDVQDAIDKRSVTTTPQNLLAQTNRLKHNEVVVTGTHPQTQEPVRIAATFYKVSPSGRLLETEARLYQLKGIANRLNIPHIPIIDTATITNDKTSKTFVEYGPDKNSFGFYKTINFSRYMFTLLEDYLKAFILEEGAGASRPMTLSEFKEFFDLMTEESNSPEAQPNQKQTFAAIFGDDGQLYQQRLSQFTAWANEWDRWNAHSRMNKLGGGGTEM